jgi:hypothetical protein
MDAFSLQKAGGWESMRVMRIYITQAKIDVEIAMKKYSPWIIYGEWIKRWNIRLDPAKPYYERNGLSICFMYSLPLILSGHTRLHSLLG